MEYYKMTKIFFVDESTFQFPRISVGSEYKREFSAKKIIYFERVKNIFTLNDCYSECYDWNCHYIYIVYPKDGVVSLHVTII